MDDIKTAMRAKDTVALEVLRAIKSETFSLKQLQVQKRKSSADEIKLLQRLKPVRTALKFTSKTMDLAEPELAQIAN
jgi:uncharacterized protein YqeY